MMPSPSMSDRKCFACAQFRETRGWKTGREEERKERKRGREEERKRGREEERKRGREKRGREKRLCAAECVRRQYRAQLSTLSEIFASMSPVITVRSR